MIKDSRVLQDDELLGRMGYRPEFKVRIVKSLKIDWRKFLPFLAIFGCFIGLILTIAIVLRKSSSPASSTEVTPKSEENKLPRGVATVLFKAINQNQENVTGLIKSGDILYSVVHRNLDEPPMLMMNTYVNDEVSKNGNSPQYNKLAADSLLPPRIFKNYSKEARFIGNAYNTGYCYKIRDLGYGYPDVRADYDIPFPKVACSKASNDDSDKLVCFLRVCTSGIRAAHVTSIAKGKGEELNSIGTGKGKSHDLPVSRYAPAQEYLVQMDYYQSSSYSYLRETYAATVDPAKKGWVYIMTSNMTLFKLKEDDGIFHLREINVVDKLASQTSELITAITVGGKYLWALLPKLKSLAKISIEEKKVLDLISLEPMTKEIDEALQKKFESLPNRGNFKKDNQPVASDYYIMTGLVYVEEHNLFYLSGQLWPYRYAFRLSDDDMK